MDLRILNYVTVLLLVLNLTGLTELSWWLVFAPSIVYLGVLLIVIAMALTIIVANGISISEFNKLIEKDKKNK